MPRIPRAVVTTVSQGQPLRPANRNTGLNLPHQLPSHHRPDGAWSLRNSVHKSTDDRSNQEPSTSGRPNSKAPSFQRRFSSASEDVVKSESLPHVAPASIDDPGSQGTWRTARVRFWLKFRTEFGQSVRVVGSHEQLGSWNLLSAPQLRWSEGDLWSATIDLPIGGVFEYKYAVVASDGRTAAAWQRGNNSVIAIRQDDTELEVFDNWEGNPGAAVVAGGTSTTREGRLLNWASEMEAILTAQRNELRETRMQLFEAQEEARSARQDAVQLRTDLILATQARLEAERKLSAVEVENTQLRMELSRKSYEFKMALEECRRLLEEVTSEYPPLTYERDKAVESNSSDKSAAVAPSSTTPISHNATYVSNTNQNGKSSSPARLQISSMFATKSTPPSMEFRRNNAPTHLTPVEEHKYMPVRPPAARPSSMPPSNAKGRAMPSQKHLIKV